MKRSVLQFGKEYVCADFFNTVLDTYGVEVRLNGEYLGSILGISLPDYNSEDCKKFDNEVINWIVDNNF